MLNAAIQPSCFLFVSYMTAFSRFTFTWPRAMCCEPSLD